MKALFMGQTVSHQNRPLQPQIPITQEDYPCCTTGMAN